MKIIIAAFFCLAVLWVLSLSCRKGHPMLGAFREFRYAHRGLHNAAEGIPENSMAAFRLAAEAGYGIELDVHLTRDGRLAVIHDTSLLRTAGADVKITDLTVDELKQYRLEGTDEQIPLLEEVLPLFEERAPVIVELKADGNDAALAAAACEVLDDFRLNFCIESFHPGVIRWLRKHRPAICRGQLSQNFLLKGNGTGRGRLADFVMTHCLTSFLTYPDFIAYHHGHRNRLSLKVARHVWGVQEFSWTLRSPEEMEVCEREGSLSIFEGFRP